VFRVKSLSISKESDRKSEGVKSCKSLNPENPDSDKIRENFIFRLKEIILWEFRRAASILGNEI
jgi:hypothetical protein